MKGFTFAAALAAPVVITTGCSTMFDRGGGTPIARHHEGVYPGVRSGPAYAGEFLTRPVGNGDLTHFGVLALPFVAADLGLSAGIETVMLPVDGVHVLTRPCEEPANPPVH
jgi:uncharacterized protein YceK